MMRQADALQVAPDGGGLGEGGDHSHASAAAIAGVDVDGKNPRRTDRAAPAVARSGRGHGVPPDVPLANYQYYVRRMQELSIDACR